MRLFALVVTIFSFLIVMVVPVRAEEGDLLACIKKNNGQTRIVDDFSECRPSELPITIRQGGVTVIGENCWRVGRGGDIFSVFKLIPTQVDDMHTIQIGIEVDESGNSLAEGEIIHGSGDIIESNLVLSLNTTSNTEEMMTSTSYSVLVSLDTLEGTYNAISHIYDKLLAEPPTTTYNTNSFSFTECPVAEVQE